MNRNGDLWKDTNGKIIDAHSPSIVKVGDTFYWFGESRESADGMLFNGVNCYSSKDLIHWDFERTVLPAEDSGPLSRHDRVISRVKVIYNRTTGKYVMYMKNKKINFTDKQVGLAISDDICGTYTYLRSFDPAGKGDTGDQTLYQEPDGTAYLIVNNFTLENREINIDLLSDDYLDAVTNLATFVERREAPNVFKRASTGYYYMIVSGTTGFHANQSKYRKSGSFGREWSALKDVGDKSTYDSQGCDVLTVEGSRQTTYIWLADRWNGECLADSRYIWLPIQFDGDELFIHYYDKWELDIATGEWKAVSLLSQDFEGMLPNWLLPHYGSWTVVEEEDGNKAYRQSNTNEGLFYSTTGFSWWNNYSVEANVKPLTFASGESAAGVCFRYEDEDNHYVASLAGNGELRLEKRTNGVKTTLTAKHYSVDSGTAYTMKAVANGNRLSVEVNGVEELDASDDTFSSGIIAFHTSSATASFDDLFVLPV